MPLLADAPGPSTAPLPAPGRPRHAVNLRSVGVGLLGVVLLCAITPFNDYVLNNTGMIGGALPVGVVLYLTLFMLLVNGPLSRFRPRAALTSGEMVVVLAMMLVACAIPASGLMRFWPALLVGPMWHQRAEPAYQQVFEALRLPGWYFPTFAEGSSPSDPLVQWFYQRIPADAPPGTFAAVLRAWAPPLAGWGVFLGGIYAAVLGASLIVSRQWIRNERLGFPIAQVQLTLIEQPAAGRWLNGTFTQPGFWIAVMAVVIVRALNGLHLYAPTYVPDLPLGYNFHAILSEPPFSYTDEHVRMQAIYLLVAGLTFFVATRISFSLWFFVLASQVPIMLAASHGDALSAATRRDVNLGAMVAFAGMILWTGRHYYGRVLRLMFRPKRSRAVDHEAVHPAVAGWMLAGGVVVAVGWLVMLKMSLGGALLLVGGLLGTWIVMANVVAQAGLPAAYALSGPREWFLPLYPNADPRAGYALTHVANQFHVQQIGGMWAYASDQLAVYATHAQRNADATGARAGYGFLGAMVLSLVVAMGVSHVSTLWSYYHFAGTLDQTQQTPINSEVLDGQPKWTMDHTLRTHRQGLATTTAQDGGWGFVAGLGMTGVLAFGQLRYAWWPLHPIGLLMVFSFSMRRIWFSIFLGWLAKVLIIRFGGARLFERARPFFMGIIIGDVLAAGLFGLLTLVLYWLGLDYKAVQFMPVSQF